MASLAVSDVTFDDQKSENFAQHLLDALNGGALSLMISIGHRSGLFDVMAELPPATSQDIARAAGLSERYVREWLASMVTGKVVDYLPDLRQYALPAEHAACLTRAAAPNNIAAVAQYLPMMGQIEDAILDCFQKGGGLPYSAYPRFHEVMAEDSGQTVVAALFDSILPLDPGLSERLARGIDVLDVGCGRGRALLELARAFPASRFTGYDLCEEATAWARAAARKQGLENILFEVRDAVDIDERQQYDLITAFDAVHDQARPDLVLERIRTALRPAGLFLMQDIRASSHLEQNLDHPIGTLFYAVSLTHCMSVSLAAGGMGLGTMWGEERALSMLADAGFGAVRVEQLPHDFQNNFYLARPQ